MNKYKILWVIIALLQFNAIAHASADGTFRLRSQNAIRWQQLQPELANIKGSVLLNRLVPQSSNMGFQVFNFDSNSYVYKEGLYLEDGKYCRLFIQQLDNKNLNKKAQKVAQVFDNYIYPMVKKWFGEPEVPEELRLPDSKVYIFLTEIAGSFSEGYISGYFDRRDLTLDGNRKPFLFMDISRIEEAELEDPSSAFYKTLAHELQHLTNYSIRKALRLPEQERWLDEAYSMYAEYLYLGSLGLKKQPPIKHLEKYLESPNIDITSNSEHLWFKEPELYQQYGASFIFMVYLVQKYGGNTEGLQSFFLKELVKVNSAGVKGLNEILSFKDITFNDVLLDFNLALAIDDMSLNNGLWAFDLKHECFGELANRLPLSGAKVSEADDCFVLPSSLVGLVNNRPLDLNAYFLQTIEIPVFSKVSLAILKKK